MAKCIELTIEDDGSMSVSMEDKVEEANEVEGAAPTRQPVKDLRSAMSTIMRMASEVLSSKEQAGFEEGYSGKKPMGPMQGGQQMMQGGM